MNKEKIEYNIRQCLGKEKSMSITPKGCSYPSSFIPLYMWNGLLLAAVDANFTVDGYVIIPLAKIKKAWCSKEGKYNEIMKKERVFDRIDPPRIDMTSLASVCACFMEARECISIDLDGGFEVGRVKEVRKNSILFKPFDAQGKWQKERKIRFDEIRDITFRDMYTRVFSKYVPDKKKD